MFKKWLFLRSQLCRTVSQGKRQHRAFLPHSQSGACRALRRAALASQGSPKEMPPSHPLAGPLPLHFQWLYSHFPHLSRDIQSFIILCKHILLNLCTPHFLNHILPSLCMPKWHIHLFLFPEVRIQNSEFIPTYLLHIPKELYLPIFLFIYGTVQCRWLPIAKRSYTMWNGINHPSKLHTFRNMYTLYIIHVQITPSGLQSYLFYPYWSVHSSFCLYFRLNLVERAVFISLYQHMYTNSDHYAVAKMS